MTLDPAAASELGDVAGALRVDDLTAAGWSVSAPDETDDGGVEVTATHEFGSPQEAAVVVAQLAEGGGPLRDLSLSQDRSFLRTRTRFATTVDLSGGLEAFSDAELEKRLGAPLGLSRGELERLAGAPLTEAFTFSVTADLPGERRTWPVVLGERSSVSTSAEAFNTTRLASAGVAMVAGSASLILLFARRLRRTRYPR